MRMAGGSCAAARVELRIGMSSTPSKALSFPVGLDVLEGCRGRYGSTGSHRRSGERSHGATATTPSLAQHHVTSTMLPYQKMVRCRQ